MAKAKGKRGWFSWRKARAARPVQERRPEGIPASVRWQYPLLFLVYSLGLVLLLRPYLAPLEAHVLRWLAFVFQLPFVQRLLREWLPLAWNISRATCFPTLAVAAAGLVLMTVMHAWLRVYVAFVLPTRNKAERDQVWRRFQWYARGLHGPAYFVMYGQRIDTYTPPHAGPQLVVLDSASAMMTYNEHEGGIRRVYGPGIHFLTSYHRVEAFCDLREHSLLISGDFQQHPALVRIDDVQVAADIFLIVYLEDFSSVPGSTEDEKAFVQNVWHRIYKRTAEQLQAERFGTTPYYGHPRSILLNFEKQQIVASGEPVRLEWWTPARDIAVELWKGLVERHTLFDLFPTAWELEERMSQDPHFRTGMERIAAEFRGRLTSPFYTDAQGRRRPSPEFQRLAEFGLRVRVASIVRVHMEEQGNRLLYQGYINPWENYVKEYRMHLAQLQHYVREAAEIEAETRWMVRLAERIRRHPVLGPTLQTFLQEAGQAGSVDFDVSPRWAMVEVLLDAWEDILNRPTLSHSEERRALERLRRWWLRYRTDDAASSGPFHRGMV